MLVEEGVGEKTVQRYSLPMVHSETAGYQVPGGRGERVLGGPEQVAGADLLVRGVGDVPAQHVVQQDTQRPDGQFVRLVFPIQDPLRWTVHTSSTELLKYFIWVFMVVVFTPGAEVNQLDVVGLHIH